MIRKAFFSFCIGALLIAPLAAQDIFVLEWKKTYSTEKQNEVINCMDVGDIDNDGNLEIVLGLSVRPLAGIQRYAVQILDRNGNRRQRWDSTYPINNVSISDYNDDGTVEILVSGADLYVLSNKAQNLNYPPTGSVVSAAIAEDLDGDGKKELITGTRSITCKSSTLNWTTSIGSQITKILVSDVNWDGALEIVILTTQTVYVLDRNGNKIWISPGTQNLRDMTVANVDQDDDMEILFSTDNMLILVWEARENGMEKEIDLKSYAADLLAVEDVNKDGIPEIVVASSKLRLEILDLEGKSVWQYRVEPVDVRDAFADMIIEDTNRDGRPDILLAHAVNSQSGGLDSFLYLLKNQEKAPPRTSGNEYLTRAMELYDKKEYSQAITVFTQAQTAFLQEGNQEMADQCQTYIDKCRELLADRAEADSKFSQAEALFQEGEYEEAAVLYEEAQTLYEKLGDSEKAQACSGRITEIQSLQVPEEEPVEAPEKRKGSGALVLVIVVAAVGVGGYFVMKRYAGRKIVTEEGEVVEEKREVVEKIAPSDRIREEERKLKAQFVYGEISREEYQEKLRKLYES